MRTDPHFADKLATVKCAEEAQAFQDGLKHDEQFGRVVTREEWAAVALKKALLGSK